MAIILDGTNGIDSPDLNITGTGARITGDFSNATVANRVMFQTSTVNSGSDVSVLPNGTSTDASLVAWNNSNPANASRISVYAASTEVSFRSAISGTGSYLPMTFYTGGSERARIDTSGNVGIGTSSPGSKLTVAGSTSLGTASSSGNTSIYQAPGSLYLTLNTNGTLSGARRNWAISPEYDVAGGLSFTVGTSEGASPTSTKMVIDSSGNLLVGTTSSTVGGQTPKLGVVGSNTATIAIDCTAASGASGVHIRRSVSNGEVMTFDSGTTRVGSISITGSATAYNTSSDYRLKENVAPMTGALATVAALKPVTYTWKADGSAGQGFIAHELQAVVPDCVTGEKDAVDAEGNPQYQGVDTSFLVATLTAAIQEQQTIIEQLKARLDAAGL